MTDPEQGDDDPTTLPLWRRRWALVTVAALLALVLITVVLAEFTYCDSGPGGC